MNLRRVILWVCCLMLLSALVGCASKPLTDPLARIRVFTQSTKMLTDGERVYIRLPNNWSYQGDYPYQIGRVKGGNALYASDENGTFVQEEANPGACMEFAPWVLSSEEVPRVPMDNVDVYIGVYGEGYGRFKLSEQAQAQFMAWYLEHLPGVADGTRHLEDPLACIYFLMTSNPDLEYNLRYHLVQRDGVLYVTSRDWMVIGTFGPETLLYQEVEAYLAKPQ